MKRGEAALAVGLQYPARGAGSRPATCIVSVAVSFDLSEVVAVDYVVTVREPDWGPRRIPVRVEFPDETRSLLESLPWTGGRTIASALVANNDIYPEILAQAKKHPASRYSTASKGEVLHTSFPPTVEVYHELAMQRTIVEIQARDQIGLLYRLAKTISDHGFDITFSRIGTERNVAIDTFYIESANHELTEDIGRLHALRDAITTIITPAVAVPLAAAK